MAEQSNAVEAAVAAEPAAGASTPANNGTGALITPPNGDEAVHNDRQYYPNFDWLRLAFAVQVVAIHAGAAPHIVIQPVAAFLAVSGFVVLGSIERLRTRSFFRNRALRVLPLLFATFAFVYFRYGGEELARNVMFWLWPFSEDRPVNEVVWTLMYEEFFYALLVVLFALKFYRVIALPFLVWISLVILLMNGAFFGIPSPFFFLGASFFLGNMAYLLKDRIARINKWVTVVVLFVASAFMWPLPYVAMVAPQDAIQTYASIAAMLLFGIAGPRLPRLRVDLSYSLYLVHTLVRQELFGVVPFGLPMFAAMLAASLPICLASWFLIERPALSLRQRGADRIRVSAPMAARLGEEGSTSVDDMGGRLLRVILGALFGAIAGTCVGYFAYSTSSGAGGAGDLPLYISSIWAPRDGPIWTGLGALLGVLWGLMRSSRR